MKSLVIVLLLLASSSSDAQWTKVARPYRGRLTSMIEYRGMIYAGTFIDTINGVPELPGIFSSTDDGTNWNLLFDSIGADDNMRIAYQGGGGIWSMASIGNDFYAAASWDGDGIFWFPDGVNSGFNTTEWGCTLASNGRYLLSGSEIALSCWNTLDSGLYYPYYPFTDTGDSKILWVDCFGVNGKTVYGGCPFGPAYLPSDTAGGLGFAVHGGVLISQDSGIKWTLCACEGLPGDTNACVVAIAQTYGNVFAAVQDSNVPPQNPCGMFRSSDNGSHWVEVNKGLFDTTVNVLLSWGSNLFAGTTNGIYLTSDNGNRWYLISDPEQQSLFNVHTLLIHDNYLFAGGDTELWRLPLSLLNLGVVENHSQDSSLTVWPNPASGEITVAGASGDVTIRDPLGRVVLRQPPSPYPLPEGEGNNVDISSVPSGIFFLSAGTRSAKFVKE